LKLKKSLLINLYLGLVVAAIITSLSQQGLLKRLEFSGLDTFFRLKQNTAYNDRIIIIEISDYDVVKVGRWPWERKWEAAIAQALARLGAKYIYFDMIFSEAAGAADDSLLEEAIRSSKNVYLPFVFQDTSFDIQKAFLPLPRFEGSSKGTGAFNIYPDIDGTTRRIPLIFAGKDKIYPHAALKIALDDMGLEIKNIAPQYLTLSGPGKEVKMPLVERNNMLINWAGKWKHTFKHYSFTDVLAAYKDYLNGEPAKINLAEFKNSICLVAVTAIGLYDIKSVPLEPEYPGIGIFATALSNIMEQNFLYPVARWVPILLLYLLAMLPAFLIFGERPFKETFAVLLVGVAYFAVDFSLFRINIWLDSSLPLLGLFGSSLAIETYNFIRVALERQSFFNMSITDGLTGLYNIRYFRMLLDTEVLMAKHDPTKKFALVMADVDHFKHFNDTYGHQVGDLVLKEIASILKNSVRSSDIAARYGGEEMILLLRGSSLKDGLNVAEKIRKVVENSPVKGQNASYKATVSLGVSIFRPGDNSDMLIKRADEALYQAKESGRNRVTSLEQGHPST